MGLIAAMAHDSCMHPCDNTVWTRVPVQAIASGGNGYERVQRKRHDTLVICASANTGNDTAQPNW